MQRDRSRAEAGLGAVLPGEEVIAREARRRGLLDGQIMAGHARLLVGAGLGIGEARLIRQHAAAKAEIVEIADHRVAGAHPQQLGAGPGAGDQRLVEGQKLRPGKCPRSAARRPVRLMQDGQGVEPATGLHRRPGGFGLQRPVPPVAPGGAAQLVAGAGAEAVQERSRKIDERGRLGLQPGDDAARGTRRVQVGLAHAGQHEASPAARAQGCVARAQQVGPAAFDEHAVVLDIDAVQRCDPARAEMQRLAAAAEQGQRHVTPVLRGREQPGARQPGFGLASHPVPALEERAVRPRLQRLPARAETGGIGDLGPIDTGVDTGFHSRLFCGRVRPPSTRGHPNMRL